MFKLKTLLSAMLISSISLGVMAENYSPILIDNNTQPSQGFKPMVKKIQSIEDKRVSTIDLSRASLNVSDETLAKIIPKLNLITNLSKSIKRIESFNSEESMIMLEDTDGNIVYFDIDVKDFIISSRQFTNLDNYLISVDSMRSINKNKMVIDNVLIDQLDSFAKFEGNKEAEIQETVYVLADYTCPYCQKMFNNIDIINKIGITVYFIPMINGGLADKNSVDITRKILCSDDKERDTLLAVKDPRGFFNDIKKDDLSCPASYNVLKVLKIHNQFNADVTPTSITHNGFSFVGHYDIETYLKDLAHGLVDGKAVFEYNESIKSDKLSK